MALHKIFHSLGQVKVFEVHAHTLCSQTECLPFMPKEAVFHTDKALASFKFLKNSTITLYYACYNIKFQNM